MMSNLVFYLQGDLPLLTYTVMASMMFIAVILTPLVPETKDLVLSETVLTQEVIVNGDAANNVRKKSMPSDNSSNEDSPQDHTYHIEAKENQLQMHLLKDQRTTFMGNGEPNGVVKQSMGHEHLNNIPV